MEIHQHKLKIPKKKKHERERDRVITFLCDKICIE